MSTVRAVLRDFGAKRATPHAVMRTLVGHDDWLVPAVYASQVLGRTQLERAVVLGAEIRHPANTLLLYSDVEVAMRVHQQGAPLGPFEGGIRGVELFARLHPSLHAVVVNEGAPQEEKLYMQGPGFGNAPVWADVVGFEARVALRAPPAELTATIRSYDAFFIALNNHDGSIVTLQRYGGVANAGVLFTAPDCLDAFMQRIGPQAAGIQTGQTTGDRVLQMLPELGIDGLAINPFGPGANRVIPLHELAGRAP